MNFRLVSKLLARIALLIAATMVFSLPWAFAWTRSHTGTSNSLRFEHDGFWALLASIAVSTVVGGILWHFGRVSDGNLYRREAMAVVGLSWVLATFLGALPYLFSGTHREPTTRMTVADALFESQSGFSTTGATVLKDVEVDPQTGKALIPRCILFWRSSTHFLGGLGIIVLFVAILGQGSAGKALMRAEMPGPSKEGALARMQHTAWVFAAIYLTLIGVLTVLLFLQGLSLFDALCHAFGTMATGGFSTYNNSVGHFAAINSVGPSRAITIEATIVIFMILAGTNFALLYLLRLGKLRKLLADVEWRTYILVILGVSLLIIVFGYVHQDREFYVAGDPWASVGSGLRHGVFQTVSILTTTGYGTAANFDNWNSLSRGVLFLLMFVGGCAGSTGGGLKVIRHILFLKILRLEIEKAYHPNVVRPLRIGGEPVDDPDLRRNILVYFGLILVIFVFSWMALVTIEPDDTWRNPTTGASTVEHKLIDSASGIAATLNNIGPGLGTVGAKQTYTHFSSPAKLLFTFLMMLGRLEIFVILVLVMPGFWRTR